jgi:hypothetical protein
MQEWESMKMKYDLAESAKKTDNDRDFVVTTNVPYEAVASHFSTTSQYDSGSRFKIPKKVWDMWGNVVDTATDALELYAIIDEFNKGGSLSEQKNKDYAPRVFLLQVEEGTSKSAKARGMSTPDLNGIRYTKYPAGKQPVSLSYAHPSVDVTMPSLPTRRSSGTKSAPKAESSKSSLKNFDAHRNAVLDASIRASAISKTREPSTKRKAGRPRKDFAVSMPSTSTTGSNGQKRKLSNAEFLPSSTVLSPSAKKTKTTSKNAAKKPTAKTAAVKKSVAFAEKEALLVAKSGPKKSSPAKKSTSSPPVKKSAIKKKGKDARSVPKVLPKETKSTHEATRGSTRSGAKFRQML